MHRILILFGCFLLYIFVEIQTSNCASFAPPTQVLALDDSAIEPVPCKTDEDCSEFSILVENFPELTANVTNKVICDIGLKICIVGTLIHDDDDDIPVTTTTTETNNNNVTHEEIESDHRSDRPITGKPSEPPFYDDRDPDRIDNIRTIPVAVWISFTIPFVSIIVLGIICGRRLKHQSESIQNNLRRTTIHGVHVDNILQQQQQDQAISAIAFTPPPTYEKATGEIPPSYETFLQALEEKRLSIFDCDSLMNKPTSAINSNDSNRERTTSVSSGSDATTISIPNSPNLLAVPRNTLR